MPEKIITVPLREAYKKSYRKRTPYAARYVRSFLATHTKADTVKMGTELNKALWSRGRSRPPRSVRVKAVTEGKETKAELVGYEYREFSAKARAERKGAKEKLMERLGPKALQKEAEEKKIEGGTDRRAKGASDGSEEAKEIAKEEKTAEKEIKKEVKEAAEKK